ncbi:MAG: hypothetical protein LBR16_03485 [Treponema sp.]|jgi:hypothetical protein|nr:hypothetical protein [Treponema sp.]
MGIAGFIFGILALIGSFIPVVGTYIARPGAALSIILCGFSLAKAIRDKQPIGGTAIAGLALSIALL